MRLLPKLSPAASIISNSLVNLQCISGCSIHSSKKIKAVSNKRFFDIFRGYFQGQGSFCECFPQLDAEGCFVFSPSFVKWWKYGMTPPFPDVPWHVQKLDNHRNISCSWFGTVFDLVSSFCITWTHMKTACMEWLIWVHLLTNILKCEKNEAQRVFKVSINKIAGYKLNISSLIWNPNLKI